MNITSKLIKLVFEVLICVAIAELIVMVTMPYWSDILGGSLSNLWDSILMSTLSAPAVYWRCRLALHSGAANEQDGEVASNSLVRALLMAFSLLVCGLSLTTVVANWDARNIDQLVQTKINQDAERLEHEIVRNFEQPLNTLLTAKGMFQTQGQISRNALETYVSSQDLFREFPGIRAIAYAQPVPQDDLKKFETSVRNESYANYTVKVQTDADTYYLVKYITPLVGNEMALGVDIGREKIRREALQRAIQTGQAALTGHITLLQDNNSLKGFLFLLPIYQQGLAPQLPEERQKALMGLLYAPIDLNALMRRASGNMHTDPLLDVELWEVGTAGVAQKIYASNTTGDSEPREKVMFQSERAFKVGGNTLKLRLVGSPQFEEAVDRKSSDYLGVGGVILSMMLALTVWLLSSSRVRAQDIANKITKQLDRTARVARHTTNAVLMTDKDFIIDWVNESLSKITGYSAQEAVGRQLKNVLGDYTDNESIQLRREAIMAGRNIRYERLCRHKTGYDYWLDVELQPIQNEDGEFTGMMVVAADITAQKKTLLELDHAVRKSDLLLNSIKTHAIVSITNRAGEIVEVNDAFCKISGYSKEELLGKSHAVVNSGFHPPEFWREMWRTIGRGKPWRAEVCNRAKNGNLYWVDSMLSAFSEHDGQMDRFISIRFEITERKRLELDLRATRDELTSTLQAIPDLLFELDLDGRYHAVHAPHAKMLDVPAESLLGKTLAEVLPSHGARVCRTGLEQAQSQGYSRGLVFEWPLSGGSRWFEISVARKTGQQGDSPRFVMLLRDITERKISEVQREEALQKAKAASEAKGQFLANMSHEIRTPMNAVLGMLQLLQKTDLSVQQLDYASKSETAAKSLLYLINDILDFSKVEAGKMTLDPQPMQVETLLRDLAVIFSAQAGKTGIDVLYDVDQTIPMVRADALRLKQILINLGGNAIKFTAKGQVVVSVRLLALDDAHATLNFAVQDSGIGIAPENQAKIFDGFEQAEASTTRKFGGTGLGLAISRRLVQLMGGQLSLSSVLGQGSRFEFTLRLARASAPASEAASLPPLRSRRVLVVDDNPEACRITASQVHHWGWPVEVAGSGEAALALVQSQLSPGAFPFDAIILDAQMADLDGWESARQLRELCDQAKGRQPAIVLLSAQSLDAQGQRSRKEQALISSQLLKPTTAAMLEEALRQSEAQPEAKRAAPKAWTSQRRLRGMRLLVVEDNLINQQVAQELLSSEGAQVLLAANGRLGVEAVLAAQAAGAQFDAVLMDLQMPVMDGFGATAEIRSHAALRALPVIAMTANAMESDREACLAAGMNDHVGKPFDLNQLVQTLLRQTDFENRPPPSSNFGGATSFAAPTELAAPTGFPSATAFAPPAAPDPGFSLSAFAPVERGDGFGAGPREPTESSFAMLGEFSPPPSEEPHLLWIEMDPAAQLPPLDGAACRVDVVTLPSEQDLAETLQSNAAQASAITLIHPGQALLASTLDALHLGQTSRQEPWVLLADGPSQDEMLQAIEVGISDMLPYDYACVELLRSDSKLADPRHFQFTAQGWPLSSIAADQAMQRMMTNADFYAQLLQAFYEEIPERIQTIREVWPGDVAQVKHHCHSVVGIALSLGLDALAEVAREAERYANSVIKAEGELQDSSHLIRMLGVLQSSRYQMLLWLHAQVRDSSV